MKKEQRERSENRKEEWVAKAGEGGGETKGTREVSIFTSDNRLPAALGPEGLLPLCVWGGVKKSSEIRWGGRIQGPVRRARGKIIWTVVVKTVQVSNQANKAKSPLDFEAREEEEPKGRGQGRSISDLGGEWQVPGALPKPPAREFSPSLPSFILPLRCPNPFPGPCF